MSVREIVGLLQEADAEKALLLCHHNADPDAVCSAYALAGLLRRLRGGLSVELVAAQGPSKLSKRLLEHLEAEFVDSADVEAADVMFLVDTNNLQQLEDLGPVVARQASRVPLIIVDHHAPHPETERIARLRIVREDYTSTCEIVYELFEEAGFKPSPKEALALFLGMAYDTRHFSIARAETFRIAAGLVQLGVDVSGALRLLTTPMELSERIARLKACQRMRLEQVGGWIIALSHVSAYQASAARALLSLGAHVAVVAGKKDEQLQVSLRCTEEFHERTGIHLGVDVAKPLGEHIGGMGGGHPTSAGANGKGELEDCLEKALELIKDGLRRGKSEA